MRLKNILLINRAPFERFELDLGDENINILSGINGAGKTTILSYIVDAFYELARIAYHNEFEENPNKYYRISSGLYSIDKYAPSVVYLRFITDDGKLADYIDFRGKFSEIYYNDIIRLPDKIPFSVLDKDMISDDSRKRWSISEKMEITSIFTNNILTYFPAYRYETPSFLTSPYSVELKFAKEMSFTGYLPNPIEVTSDLPQIANWIMDIVLDHEIYKGKASTLFVQINNVLNDILSSKVGCRTRVGIGQRTLGLERIAVMDRDIGEKIVYPSIFCMSSGELALLCLFGELVKQADKISKVPADISGIVLVDEIDKHLHIKLQKEILPRLISLFPNIQFITSSHSPFLGLGLSEADIVTYKIYDLDNNGTPCPPQDNELFKEVYTMMISENNRYASMYKALQEKVNSANRPLVITEGKTDWKHLKAAMRALNITDLDFDFYEYEDTLGDVALLQMLKDYARFKQVRMIIGIFDRDNFSKLKNDELKTQEYITFQNNVYAFAIPLVNADEYGNEISIEHYYNRSDLTKEDSNGRRLFLGEEFYERGMGKNKRFLTRCSEINNKSKNNGIVDDKVYDITIDPEEKHSIALPKNSFAELILKHDSFADGFDFSNFTKIFDVMRKIISENSTANAE